MAGGVDPAIHVPPSPRPLTHAGARARARIMCAHAHHAHYARGNLTLSAWSASLNLSVQWSDCTDSKAL